MGVTLPQPATVGELSTRLGGDVDAPVRDRRVTRLVVPAEAAQSAELVVLTSARYVAAALEGDGPVLCSQQLAGRVPVGRRWTHSHVMWAVTRMLGSPAPYARPSAPEARVSPEARVAPSAYVAAGAVVMAEATIGPDCEIRENCVVYPRVQLGARVLVGPLSVLGRPGFGWTPAPEGGLVRVAQLGGVVIEDDVEIGPLCTVDAGTLAPTRIGRGAKLDAHVHVGHNVVVGAGSLVAGQAGFAGSAELGAGVMVGGQAGVADHARVGAGARIAAHSGVIGDVPAGAVVAGFPAVMRLRWLRAWARLLRLADRRRP
jgi:UDP-3-O-[3-hydroxymyristoyl] glucosamine N-acyltransferase